MTNESEASGGLPEDLTPSLIDNMRAGRPEAGRILDVMYRAKLINFCYRYVGAPDVAEDIVQDVFVKVLQNETVPDNFKAWIYKICRNRCLDVLRTSSRRRDDKSLPAASQLQDQMTGFLTRLVEGERLDHLQKLVDDMPEDQREALMLRYGESLSRAEIAEVLDVSEGIVKSKLYHGLERLRTHESLIDD